MKYFKWVLWGAGALLLVFALIAIYVGLTFDPNAYKPELVKLVKERTGRNLLIDGPISLKFFPKVGAGVEGFSLSEPNSAQVFAKVNQASVSLALLPLLSGKFIVDRIKLDGLQADLVRDKNGHTNFEDLLDSDKEKAAAEGKSEPAEKKALVLDIGGIELTKANLGWRDESKAAQWRIADLNFDSGRIASGVPGELALHARIEGDDLALKVDLSAEYLFDFENKSMAFSELKFSALGDAAGQRGLNLALNSKTLVLDLSAHTLQMPALGGDFSISGSSPLKLNFQGSAHMNWEAQEAGAELGAKLDDSNLHLKLDLKNFDKPMLDVDLEADRLDVDHYSGKPSAAAAGKTKPARAGKEIPAEAPIDLSMLNAVDAHGGIRIGALTASGLKAQNFSLRFDLRNGHLNVNPLTAKFYEGQLSGSFAVDAGRNEYVVKQSVAGVNVGPLLRDLADKDLLEGRGNVSLDVRAAGATTSALKRALAGNAKLVLKEGALKGVNLAGLLRKAKAILGSKSATEELAQGGEKTDFSDLSASFLIREGVAHNDDLQLRSPFLRVGGAGDINIGQSSMDYLAKVTVVDTSTGQGGKELADLRGLTVPVRVSGPLDRLKYKVDAGTMAKDAAKQEIQKQIDKRLGGESKDGGSPTEKLLRGLLKKK